jgi:hypothetical protein
MDRPRPFNKFSRVHHVTGQIAQFAGKILTGCNHRSIFYFFGKSRYIHRYVFFLCCLAAAAGKKLVITQNDAFG